MVNTFALTVPEDSKSRPRRRKVRARFRRAVVPTTLLWVLASLMAFPLLWFLLSSFKPGGELFTYPLSLFPKEWTLQGYADALERIDFVQYFANTAIVATVTTVFTVFLCATT
jgi:alpha-1,4-digalacturonate transport system permease protein